MNFTKQFLSGLALVTLLTSSAYTATESDNTIPPEPPQPRLNFGRPCQNPFDPDTGRRSNYVEAAPDPSARNAKPNYPRVARQYGQEGTVMLSMYVVEDGSIGEVRIHRSSGWPMLDNAALESVRDWKITPGRNGGKAVCTWVQSPIIFKLTDYSRQELSAAVITPQAIAVARALLGATDAQESIDKLATERDSASIAFMRQLVGSLLNSVEAQAIDKGTASILALEFSPAELLTLNEELAKPELRKLLRVMPKFEHPLKDNRQRLSSLTECVAQSIDESVRNKFGVSTFSDGVPQAAIDRTPDLVNTFMPFCSCAVESYKKSIELGKGDPCPPKPEATW